MNTIRYWLNNSRTTALPQSLLPAMLALCMAVHKEGFSLWIGALAVFGGVMAHLGMNLFDDYFDFRVKNADFRDRMKHRGFRARIAKCPYLTSGKSSLGQLLAACCVFTGIALACGVAVWWFRGNFILILAAVAALLGVSYSGAPLRLSYHGWGDLLIGVMFGPMLMTGVYYAACGSFDLPVLFVSVPVGLLVADVVYVHSIMDFEPDREVGKMTFAGLLQNKERMLMALLILLALAFLFIAGGVAGGYLSPLYLLSLLTVPMAVALYRLMVAFVRHPEQHYQPRPWMGPMGNWKAISEIGIDWFMIRWFLARNLLSLFCLILMIVSLIVKP